MGLEPPNMAGSGGYSRRFLIGEEVALKYLIQKYVMDNPTQCAFLSRLHAIGDIELNADSAETVLMPFSKHTKMT
jgi:hypothetical protein